MLKHRYLYLTLEVDCSDVAIISIGVPVCWSEMLHVVGKSNGVGSKDADASTKETDDEEEEGI